MNNSSTFSLYHTSDEKFKEHYYRMFELNNTSRRKRTGKKHRYKHIDKLYEFIKNNDNVFLFLSEPYGFEFNKYKNNHSTAYWMFSKILDIESIEKELVTMTYQYDMFEESFIIDDKEHNINYPMVIVGADTYGHKHNRHHILYHIFHTDLEQPLTSLKRKLKIENLKDAI